MDRLDVSRRDGERRGGDLMNLLLAGGSLAAVLVETASVWVIPQGGE